MTDNNDMLQLFKTALEKEHEREFTEREIKKSFQLLEFFAEVAIDNAMTEAERKKRLETTPRGFHLEGAHTCELCRSIFRNESTWYDAYGIKCINCQSAIDRQIVSPKLHLYPERFYTLYDLEQLFNLDKKLVQRWTKDRILKARIIPKGKRGVHFTLFLVKDNKDFLPPKYLVEPTGIIEEVDGRKEYIFPVQWYRLYKNPIARISKYGIAKYLSVITA
ncbi:hypothetical protein GWC95_15810 [Sediminibacterium roseum]|uniref:Uncharacterized protein n=1 Tax=Sediminibacterium roseum TaxID=1978412 RepID=A0ABX0A2G2_9BACT|nr:hypothetical protein [Sediminibacterium roseum]NCI51395.1 hypothetical protein [Sediminibacterium roseum]